jgi:replicative DNA helicase
MKSPQIEYQLISEIFYEPKILDEIRQLINPSVFTEEKCKVIYSAFCEIEGLGKNIDSISVYEYIKNKGLAELIPIKDLTKIQIMASSSANFSDHCKYLLEKWMKRGLVLKMENAHEKIKLGEDVFDVISSLSEDIYQIENNIKIEKDRDLFSELPYLLNQVEQKWEGNIPEGIKIKSFPTINTATGGIMPDDFIIVYGKEKSAKTTVTERIILDFAFQGFPVAMFPLEMSFDASAYKAISMECGIEYLKLRNPRGNNLKAHELDQLIKSSKKFSETKIIIDDKTFDFDRIIGKMKILKRKYNIGLFVIDYAGLIQADRRFEAKRFELKHYSSRLKMLGKQLQTPIILVSQANNEGKTSESVDLLRDCDFALLCCKPFHDGIISANFGTKENPRYYDYTEDDFLITVERARFGRDKQNFVVGYSGTKFIERDLFHKEEVFI